jgi:hypothetical protein
MAAARWRRSSIAGVDTADAARLSRNDCADSLYRRARPRLAQATELPRLETNEAYVEDVLRPNSLAITDPLAVFAFVLASLPERVKVYPTENYYYLRFAHNGIRYAGDIRLDAGDRGGGGSIRAGAADRSHPDRKMDEVCILPGQRLFPRNLEQRMQNLAKLMIQHLVTRFMLRLGIDARGVGLVYVWTNPPALVRRYVIRPRTSARATRG